MTDPNHHPQPGECLLVVLVEALGLPAATVPVGRTSAGLPVGIQVITPYLRDRDAVRVAGLIAEVSGGYARPPGY